MNIPGGESSHHFHHFDQSIAKAGSSGKKQRRQTVNMNNKQIESGAPFTRTRARALHMAAICPIVLYIQRVRFDEKQTLKKN